MRFPILLIALSALTFMMCGCIGRQPMQQGEWSAQDGFRTKVAHAHTPEVEEHLEH